LVKTTDGRCCGKINYASSIMGPVFKPKNSSRLNFLYGISRTSCWGSSLKLLNGLAPLTVCITEMLGKFDLILHHGFDFTKGRGLNQGSLKFFVLPPGLE
jgi:hypothetical protein